MRKKTRAKKKNGVLALIIITVVLCAGFFLVNHFYENPLTLAGNFLTSFRTDPAEDSEVTVEQLQRTIAQLESTINEMQRTIDRLTAGDANQSRLLSESEVRVNSLANENRALEQRVTERENRIITIQNERDNISLQVTRLQTENTAQTRQITELRNQLEVIRELLQE
ncbi:MAG: hypothetical protein FWC97_03105 [Treponema sp.]|nr:hypothetical protein [Treponema sp.]